MTIKQVNLTVDGRNCSLPLDRIPEITPIQTHLLYQLNPTMPLPKAVCEIKGRATLLATTVANLVEAKTHSTRDKVLAVTIPAVFVMLIATAILGFMAAAPIVGGITVILTALYASACGVRAGLPASAAAPILGPLALAVQLFTKVTSLDKSVTKQTKETSESLTTAREFWKQNGTKLAADIAREIAQTKSTLSHLNEHSPLAKTVQTYIQNIEQLQTEVRKGQELLSY